MLSQICRGNGEGIPGFPRQLCACAATTMTMTDPSGGEEGKCANERQFFVDAVGTADGLGVAAVGAILQDMGESQTRELKNSILCLIEARHTTVTGDLLAIGVPAPGDTAASLVELKELVAAAVTVVVSGVADAFHGRLQTEGGGGLSLDAMRTMVVGDAMTTVAPNPTITIIATGTDALEVYLEGKASAFNGAMHDIVEAARKWLQGHVGGLLRDDQVGDCYPVRLARFTRTVDVLLDAFRGALDAAARDLEATVGDDLVAPFFATPAFANPHVVVSYGDDDDDDGARGADGAGAAGEISSVGGADGAGGQSSASSRPLQPQQKQRVSLRDTRDLAQRAWIAVHGLAEEVLGKTLCDRAWVEAQVASMKDDDVRFEDCAAIRAGHMEELSALGDARDKVELTCPAADVEDTGRLGDAGMGDAGQGVAGQGVEQSNGQGDMSIEDRHSDDEDGEGDVNGSDLNDGDSGDDGNVDGGNDSDGSDAGGDGDGDGDGGGSCGMTGVGVGGSPQLPEDDSEDTEGVGEAGEGEGEERVLSRSGNANSDDDIDGLNDLDEDRNRNSDGEPDDMVEEVPEMAPNSGESKADGSGEDDSSVSSHGSRQGTKRPRNDGDEDGDSQHDEGEEEEDEEGSGSDVSSDVDSDLLSSKTSGKTSGKVVSFDASNSMGGGGGQRRRVDAEVVEISDSDDSDNSDDSGSF